MRLGSRKPRLHGLLCRHGEQYLILGLSGLTLSVFSKDRREGGTLSADSVSHLAMETEVAQFYTARRDVPRGECAPSGVWGHRWHPDPDWVALQSGLRDWPRTLGWREHPMEGDACLFSG